MLGRISKAELNEVNRVLGGTKSYYNRGNADLYCINWISAAFYLAGGLSFALMGITMHKTNLLWAPAGFLPFIINWTVQRRN